MSTWQTTIDQRRALLLDGLNITALEGVEIGALCFPAVRRNEGRITYVDYTSTDHLRQIYAPDPNVECAALVEVDAIWGEQSMLECLGGRQVDYVIASHVAEHVPDLITWLAEIKAILKPGGQVRLVLPDRRFSHDVKRQDTRLSDLLTAWLIRARRPQVRDILDFRLNVASGADAAAIYEGRQDPAALIPDHAAALAIDSARWLLQTPTHYFDVHCLAVSAHSFVRLMTELAREGLLGLACAKMIDTAPPLFEFYAFLEQCDDQDAIVRSWHAAQNQVHDPLPGSAAARAEHDQALMRLALTELANIKRSISWRMMAPLRKIRKSLLF